MENKTTKKMIIAADSCNGEEEQFKIWMEKNYPEIKTTIENTLYGGYYENDEFIAHENYWEEYCGQ